MREDPPSPGERGYNVFRNLVLHGFKEEDDFRAVYAGISRLLNNLHRSRSAYIPGSGVTVRLRKPRPHSSMSLVETWQRGDDHECHCCKTKDNLVRMGVQ